MKPTTILSVLPLLGLAAALPQNHIRGTDDEAAIMAPDISREKAMAMAEMLESVDEEESFAEELAIDEYGLLEDCKPVTVIFAKGTGEWGNMGNGHSPGPAWVAAIRNALGTENVSVQGIKYFAGLVGYLQGGSPSGSTTFLETIIEAITKCPDTKLVLGGYSQGAQILHNAVEKLDAATTAKIAAVVMFGDPNKGKPVGTVPADKVLNNCHGKDIICDPHGGGPSAHLNYPMDAAGAAAFVVERL